MNCCKSPQCQGVEKVFDEGLAHSELERYRKSGPSKQTRALLEVIQARGVQGFSLLDIGGGVGAIQHALHKAGVVQITNVDASSAYSFAARTEAEACGYLGQAAYRVGNFVEIAPSLAPFDIVTLDRVICCFDDMPALVQASSERANRIYGVVYPRDTWYARLGVKFANFGLWLSRNPFRIFIHSALAVEQIISENGFVRIFSQKGFFWQVFVYEKQG